LAESGFDVVPGSGSSGEVLHTYHSNPGLTVSEFSRRPDISMPSAHM